MKTCILLGSDPSGTGGIQQFTRMLVKELRGQGVDISQLYISKSDLIGKVMYVWRLLSICRLRHVKLLICAHIQFAKLAMVCGFFFRVPYILFAHGIETWHIRRFSLEWFTLKFAAKIGSVSRYTRKRILAYLPEREKDIELIPPTFDDARFKIHSESGFKFPQSLVGRKSIVLSVCRLNASEKYKGYDRIFDVLPAIRRLVPDVTYVIVGEGDDKRRIVDRISELGLEGCVILAGEVSDDDLVHYYQICDVFALPSLGEGFGIVFLEALACGKPVIAGNEDGSSDPLLDGRIGRLVSLSSSEELQSAILDALKGVYAQDANFLREMVLEHFGTAIFSRNVRNFFRPFI